MSNKSKDSGWLILDFNKDISIVITHNGDTLLVKFSRNNKGKRKIGFQGPKCFKIDRLIGE